MRNVQFTEYLATLDDMKRAAEDAIRESRRMPSPEEARAVLEHRLGLVGLAAEGLALRLSMTQEALESDTTPQPMEMADILRQTAEESVRLEFSGI